MWNKNKIEKCVYNEVLAGNIQGADSEREFYVFSLKSLEGLLSLVFSIGITMVIVLKNIDISKGSLKVFGKLDGLTQFGIPYPLFLVSLILLLISVVKPSRFYKTGLTMLISKGIGILTLLVISKNFFCHRDDSLTIALIFLFFQVYLRPIYNLANRKIRRLDKKEIIFSEKIADHLIVTAPLTIVITEILLFCILNIVFKYNVITFEHFIARFIIGVMVLVLVAIVIIVEKRSVKRLINVLVILVIVCLVVVSFFGDVEALKSLELVDYCVLVLELILVLSVVFWIDFGIIYDSWRKYVSNCSVRNINPYFISLMTVVTTVSAPLLFIYLGESDAFFLLGVYVTMLFLLVKDDTDVIQKFLIMAVSTLTLVVIKLFVFKNEFFDLMFTKLLVGEVLIVANLFLVIYYVNLYLNDEYYAESFKQIFPNDIANFEEFSVVERKRIVRLIREEDFDSLVRKYDIPKELSEKSVEKYWVYYYYNIFKFQLRDYKYSEKKIRKQFEKFCNIKVSVCDEIPTRKLLFLEDIQRIHHVKKSNRVILEKNIEFEEFLKQLLNSKKETYILQKREPKLVGKMNKLKIQMLENVK